MAHIVIVGSGIAGLFAAAKLADANHNVTVITKQRTKDSSTNWAQGGIAAILDKTNHDGMEAHVQDTLRSGDGLCNEEVVRSIILEAGERINDLINIGVNFEQRNDGSFSLAKEGGHSENRILHAKDATGKEIERALTQYAERHANITLLPNTLAIDLIQRQHGVDEEGIAGVWCLDQISNEVLTVEADAIMLATGGVGRLWKATTNPSVATGDGLAMAYRAGACVQDLAFIQFHPTALFAKSNRPFLMSEALRGEGAVLLDHDGYERWIAACEKAKEEAINPPKPNSYSFTLNHSKDGSMATRDIVARAIDQCLKTTGKSHVFLVTSHLDSKELKQHFPNIQRRLTMEGIELGIHPIPVVPAAHYMVGGIKVDHIGRAFVRNSREIMPHLYAIGASNSLLEAVVYAHRASEFLIKNPPPTYEGRQPQWRAEGLASLREHAPIMHDRNSLLTTMDQEVGIVRTNQRLERASRRLELFHDEIDMLWRECIPSRELIELRNLSLIGTLVVEDALLQTSNSGLHFNLDLIEDGMPQ
jgi:L-aspartate oxidase